MRLHEIVKELALVPPLKREGEWETLLLYRVTAGMGEFYVAHPNGGSEGSYDRLDGDGVWRERPVEPTRKVGLAEAVALARSWGYSEEEIDSFLGWPLKFYRTFVRL